MRRGAAAVEAAICFPLIIILMMGTLEICAGIYLKESLSICAFEGCRVGVRRRATREMVLARVNEVLADRQVVLPTDGSGNAVGVEVLPTDWSGLRELDQITVRITAPTQGNSLYIFDSMVNRNVTSQVTMVREFNE
ncbi:MAG: TadE family protein [Planctomycetota bacterium]